MTYRAVLIDLDGTLVDTLSEIAAAANAMLRDAGRPPMSERATSEVVGEGAAALVAALVGQDGVDAWLPVYLAHYRRHNGTTATLYPGAREGLDAMRAAGLAIACVTNKPRELVGPLFDLLGIADRFDCIVGGGDTVEKKPHPAPLLHACAAMRGRTGRLRDDRRLEERRDGRVGGGRVLAHRAVRLPRFRRRCGRRRRPAGTRNHVCYRPRPPSRGAVDHRCEPRVFDLSHPDPRSSS